MRIGHSAANTFEVGMRIEHSVANTFEVRRRFGHSVVNTFEMREANDVWKNDGVETIANEQGNRMTPSYVAFTESEWLIGDAAKNQTLVFFVRSIRCWKLGCSFQAFLFMIFLAVHPRPPGSFQGHVCAPYLHAPNPGFFKNFDLPRSVRSVRDSMPEKGMSLETVRLVSKNNTGCSRNFGSYFRPSKKKDGRSEQGPSPGSPGTCLT